MDKLQTFITQREKIAKKIKELQKERKRLNNAISQVKHRINKKVK